MKRRYLVQQSVDINIEWVYETETTGERALESELRDAQFDPTKIIQIQVLDWDRPWDYSEVSDTQAFLTDEQLQKWKDAGVL